MLSGIGDILAATPAIDALKRRYPQARITMIMRPRLAPLLANHPAVRRVIAYNGGSGGRLAFFRQLRDTRYDLWVDLHAPTFHTVSSAHRVFLRNAIIMAAARTRYRLGFAVPLLRPRLTHAVAVPDEATRARTNIVDTTCALLPDDDHSGRQKRLEIPAEDMAWARRQMQHSDAPRYAFFFGGRQSASHWPVARAVEFVTLFVEEFPRARLLLIGDIHERRMVDELLGKLPHGAVERIDDMVSQSGLARTAALLQLCAAAVCTDSGPMHMADAVGIPLVALFSSKNHVAVWEPVGPRASVCNYPIDCGPCFQSTCPIGNRCMEQISAAEALAALQAVSGAGAALDD